MALIQLTPAERKEKRGDAHHLDPVVMIGADGLTPADLGTPYLDVFPYLGVPYDGYDHPAA